MTDSLPDTAADDLCRNLSWSWDSDECVEPFGHDGLHGSADGTHGWGDPPEFVRSRCRRCWFRRRCYARAPLSKITGRWLWTYYCPRGHERRRPW